MVARLGGDEFVILVEDVRNREQVYRIANRILTTLQKPAKNAGQNILRVPALASRLDQKQISIARRSCAGR